MKLTPKQEYSLTWRDIEFSIKAPDVLWVDLLTVDLNNPETLEAAKMLKENHQGLLAHLRLEEVIAECKLIETRVENYTGGWEGNQERELRQEFEDISAVRTNIAQLIERASIQAFWKLSTEIESLTDRLVKTATQLKEFHHKTSLRETAEKYWREHRGYVYLFKLSNDRHYKIGYSNNPQRRGREITSGLPIKLELIHKIPSNQVACLEFELHRRFSGQRFEATEWFALKEEDVAYICEIKERNYDWVNNPEWEAFYKMIEERRETNRANRPNPFNELAERLGKHGSTPPPPVPVPRPSDS